MFIEYVREENQLFLSNYAPLSVKRKIIRNVKEFLSLYLFAKYSSNIIIKNSSDKKLKKSLNEYIELYPNLSLNTVDRIYLIRPEIIYSNSSNQSDTHEEDDGEEDGGEEEQSILHLLGKSVECFV